MESNYVSQLVEFLTGKCIKQRGVRRIGQSWMLMNEVCQFLISFSEILFSSPSISWFLFLQVITRESQSVHFHQLVLSSSLSWQLQELALRAWMIAWIKIIRFNRCKERFCKCVVMFRQYVHRWMISPSSFLLCLSSGNNNEVRIFDQKEVEVSRDQNSVNMKPITIDVPRFEDGDLQGWIFKIQQYFDWQGSSLISMASKEYQDSVLDQFPGPPASKVRPSELED